MARVAPEKAIHHRPAISFSDDYSVMERCMLLIEDRRHYVYAHARATTGEIFYIGKGSNGRAHDMTNRGAWHKSVVTKHGVDVHILEKDMTALEAYARERQLIIDAREMGLNLVNMTDGGEGVLNPNKATRAKLGKSGENHRNYGRTGELAPMFGKTGDKNPMFGKGYLLTGEKNGRYGKGHLIAGENNPMHGKGYILAGEKHYLYGKGHLVTGENNHMYGKKHTEEAKAKIRAAKLGKKQSDEARAKQGESIKGEKNHRWQSNPSPSALRQRAYKARKRAEMEAQK